MQTTLFRKEIVLFFAMSVLFFVGITAFDPFVSSYAAELGVSPVWIGGIVGITGLASVLSRLPVGVFSGMLARRKIVIQAGLLLTLLAWGAAWLAPSAITLFMGKFANGLAGSTWVVYTVLFTAYFASAEGARAMAVISLASPVGSLLGSAIGGWVIQHLGYGASFAVPVAAALLALSLTLLLPDDVSSAAQAKYDRRVFWRQVSDKALWAISALGIATQMVMYGTRDYYTPLLAAGLGADPIAIGWMSNAHLLAFAVSTALCPLLYRGFGLLRTGLAGFLLQGVAVASLVHAPALPAMFAAQAAAGFGYGMSFTFLMSIVLRGASETEKTTRMGFFQSVYSLGMFGGPFLMGVFVESFSPLAGYTFFGALSIAAMWVARKLPSYEEIRTRKAQAGN